MLTPASDSLDAAIEAARQVLGGISDVSNLQVLHATNNVVVSAGDFVAKVTTNNAVAHREYLLARHASSVGAPAFVPVMPPVTSDGFTIVVWPRGTLGAAAPRRDSAVALRSVQQAWRGFDTRLPTLAGRLDEARGLLRSGELDGVLEPRSAAKLDEIVGDGIDAISDRLTVIHGEPHDGNFVVQADRLMVIDFEAVCVGPMEWDAAFFPDDVVAEVWPETHMGLLQQMRVVVSATVSAYCWRHLAVRGEDAEMRSHAQSHLDRAIGQGA
ncbi:MAG: phosphotransferase [Actinomycetes bacterium]